MGTQKITVVQELDSQVMSVIGSQAMAGFEKAYLVADATGKLKELLTPEYMRPIMNLQGNKLGFKADKVYTEDVVKNCLIEAVLTGVNPVGNQFNIIAGNCYITKEGFGYLLSKVSGLWYNIVPDLPRVKEQSAAIIMTMNWSLNGGEKQVAKIDIPIKVNNYMGTDAIIGKATRKARAWLYNTITGCEISDGDISDLDSKNFVNAEIVNPTKDEDERVLSFLNKCNSIDAFNELKNSLTKEVLERLFNELQNKENELILNETK